MGHLRGRSERRRRWSDAEKRRIVAEALLPGVRAVEIAHRYTLNLNQLYSWCRQYRGDLPANAGGGIVPIEVRAEASANPVPEPASVMTISMPSGLRIELEMSANEMVLRRVFSALRFAE